MKVKDLEQFFPRWNDDSGFDVQIVYNEPKHEVVRRSDSYHPTTKPGQRELTVKAIRCGLLHPGGSFDEQLTIYVEEIEKVEEDEELRRLEHEAWERAREKEQEERDRKEYERLKQKYD